MTDSWRRCSSHSNLPGNKLSSQGHLCFGLASQLQLRGLRTGQVVLGSPLYIEKDPIFRYKERLQFHWSQIRKCLPLWMGIFMHLNLVSWTFQDTLMKCVCTSLKEKARGARPTVKILARRQLMTLSSHVSRFGFFPLRHINSLSRGCQSEPNRRLIFPCNSFLT